LLVKSVVESLTHGQANIPSEKKVIYDQWSFQEPIYWRYLPKKKAYFSGLNFREYLHQIWPEIWCSISIFGSRNFHQCYNINV
jgi:hypothetical protein